MSLTRRHFLVRSASLPGASPLPSAVLCQLDRFAANPAAAVLPTPQHRGRELGEDTVLGILP